MTALAQLKMPTAQSEQKSDDVLIHVRFHPNAEIFSIDERPEHLSPRDWYYRLHEAASERYQAFAGGRGFFRIPRSQFEAISGRSSN